jgi:hypothetical protein
VASATPQPSDDDQAPTDDQVADNAAAAKDDAAVAKLDAASTEDNQSLQIEISAMERTWLSIVTDGQMTFSGMLEAAETKVLQGHEKAQLRTGNAGGINVVFNGRNIGPIGSRGQVRTVVFTKDNYEVLESPSAADTAAIRALSTSPSSMSEAF